eukprot:TRINITY_DN17088_c0_g1_i1.p1 TRINITY_DN17088_c0_g1~~TRINITY_DN17088_c0_g1_i1.p1  ORF type:complete len:259 (+),score=69.57 TRINITY_DN17088_c0_g1_i1:46-777(+)
MLRRGALSGQVRFRISGLSDNLKIPQGQLTGVGKEDPSINIVSLGCVLDRPLVKWDGFGNVRSTAWKMLRAWWGMQEVKRRRDDLEREGMEAIFKRFYTALNTKDLPVLKEVVSVYEYMHFEKQIKDERKKRSLKEITDKPTAAVDVTSFTIVAFQSLEFKNTDFIQINTRFTGDLTLTSPLKGTVTTPFDIYVVFEAAQPTNLNNNVFTPLKIAGCYTPEGDRIGEDSIDPLLFKSQAAASA